MAIEKEVKRRRTFAIISHPDAGKTTMTEKLLLYGGAIHQAGSVKARKASTHATSDWMEIEKQRGISVTSSVMQFEYNNYCINILDTPGHQDFYEDTYRTLCAADAAVMLIDGAKGVEPQTIKLFKVCRLRHIPIFTFINKMDRASKPPLELIDEIEKVLGIKSYVMNWPIGIHGDFQGVYNRLSRQVELYRKGQDHGAKKAQITVADLNDEQLVATIGENYCSELRQDIELLDEVGEEFEQSRINQGLLTPLYFGSAITNFGVETFLQSFLELAPSPQPKMSSAGMIEPNSPEFSAFVFKIQANMNPGHRDRIAFMRICSGQFTPNMEVKLQRNGKILRIVQPQQFMAQEHKSVTEAYAGDIIGVFDPGNYRIADTLTEKNRNFTFGDIPVFPAEHFARISPKDSMKRKAFVSGMEQLAQEGAIQIYKEYGIGTETYICGVVGILQLDVLEVRLQNEYNVAINRQLLNYHIAGWVDQSQEAVDLDELNLTSTTMKVLDQDEQPVLLFESNWAQNWALEKNPGLKLLSIREKH